MSRLYMTAQADNRAVHTKRGHNQISVHTRGWAKGVQLIVTGTKDSSSGRDLVDADISLTGGSNRPGSARTLVTIDKDNRVKFHMTESQATKFLNDMENGR